jgi:hypothetical protein
LNDAESQGFLNAAPSDNHLVIPQCPSIIRLFQYERTTPEIFAGFFLEGMDGIAPTFFG